MSQQHLEQELETASVGPVFVFECVVDDEFGVDESEDVQPAQSQLQTLPKSPGDVSCARKPAREILPDINCELLDLEIFREKDKEFHELLEEETKQTARSRRKQIVWDADTPGSDSVHGSVGIQEIPGVVKAPRSYFPPEPERRSRSPEPSKKLLTLTLSSRATVSNSQPPGFARRNLEMELTDDRKSADNEFGCMEGTSIPSLQSAKRTAVAENTFNINTGDESNGMVLSPFDAFTREGTESYLKRLEAVIGLNKTSPPLQPKHKPKSRVSPTFRDVDSFHMDTYKSVRSTEPIRSPEKGSLSEQQETPFPVSSVRNQVKNHASPPRLTELGDRSTQNNFPSDHSNALEAPKPYIKDAVSSLFMPEKLVYVPRKKIHSPKKRNTSSEQVSEKVSSSFRKNHSKALAKPKPIVVNSNTNNHIFGNKVRSMQPAISGTKKKTRSKIQSERERSGSPEILFVPPGKRSKPPENLGLKKPKHHAVDACCHTENESVKMIETPQSCHPHRRSRSAKTQPSIPRKPRRIYDPDARLRYLYLIPGLTGRPVIKTGVCGPRECVVYIDDPVNAAIGVEGAFGEKEIMELLTEVKIPKRQRK